MTRLVALTRSAEHPQHIGYDIRLGPVLFVTPADQVGESLGDGLDVVGAGLVPAERKPRPLKLKVPVRGYDLDPDPTEAGRRLRRQVRGLIDNARQRLQGLYFTWEADTDLDCWLIIGGAELIEATAGVTFGEYEMEFSDVYVAGRPGTHRPGRRADIADRRSIEVPRDTRRRLYSTDFNTQPLPSEPVVLPGDIVGLTTTGNRPVISTVLGPEREGARHLWRAASGVDGETLSYMPDPDLVPGRGRFIDLDDLGSVRVWNLAKATVYPPDPTTYSTERDIDPDLFYGWERVLGDSLTADEPLVIENGAVRLIWLGAGSDEGLAIEWWDATAESYSRLGRILHAQNVSEQRVVEITTERGVIEWRSGRYSMRAILQRGWYGPRLESYDDGGEAAQLQYAIEDGSGAVTTFGTEPSWVHDIYASGGGDHLYWASGTIDEVFTNTTTMLSGLGATVKRDGVLVAQLACPNGLDAPGLASLSLIDAQAVPVLVGRG